jgi:complex iron-sulfur molybdoenzyme family reductase subunit gamma
MGERDTEADGRLDGLGVDGRELTVVAVVAVALLAGTVLLPAVVSARPAFAIPVHYATGSDAGTLQQPTGAGWAEAPAVTVPLASAASGVPAADNTSVERLNVEAARTNDRLYLRLSWADATRDTSNERIKAFADAAAVQLPVNTSARPPIAMGGADNPVNVWYWSAGSGGQELLAGGPGSTTTFDTQTVLTNRSYSDGRWTVVLSRPLGADGANRTAVPSNQDVDVAFATWNGSNMERSGRKGASDWYYLALGPGPQGPPYEAILWAVAGIGIVATTLVTIEGIRRTRGGDPDGDE